MRYALAGLAGVVVLAAALIVPWTILWLNLSLVGLLWFMMVVNCAVMAMSPSAWFRLPSWLRATDSLSRDKYTTGSGAVVIRVSSAVMLAAMLYLVVRIFRYLHSV